MFRRPCRGRPTLLAIGATVAFELFFSTAQAGPAADTPTVAHAAVADGLMSPGASLANTLAAPADSVAEGGRGSRLVPLANTLAASPVLAADGGRGSRFAPVANTLATSPVLAADGGLGFRLAPPANTSAASPILVADGGRGSQLVPVVDAPAFGLAPVANTLATAAVSVADGAAPRRTPVANSLTPLRISVAGGVAILRTSVAGKPTGSRTSATGRPPASRSALGGFVKDRAMARVLGEMLFRDTVDVMSVASNQPAAATPEPTRDNSAVAQVARTVLAQQKLDRYLWLIQQAYDDELWRGGDRARIEQHFPLIWRTAIMLYESTLNASPHRVRVCTPADNGDGFDCRDEIEHAKIVPIPSQAPLVSQLHAGNVG